MCVTPDERHRGWHRSLPCSLLLSPLCDVCPPLEGPGVPPERVDAVSSWSLFQEVCEGGGGKEEERDEETVALYQHSVWTNRHAPSTEQTNCNSTQTAMIQYE